jgi:hypothetical protein
MAVWLAVGVGVRVCVRTGRIGERSAAGLAVVPAARLPQHGAAPEVAPELAELLRQRHGLIEVG